jgi:hypothetical protein
LLAFNKGARMSHLNNEKAMTSLQNKTALVTAHQEESGELLPWRLPRPERMFWFTTAARRKKLNLL